MVADLVLGGPTGEGLLAKGALKVAFGGFVKGFAKKGVGQSFKGLTKNFLAKNGIKNIHKFKATHLGTTKNLKLFDVVKNTKTHELMIIRKETQQIIIENTGKFIKN